jgi:hypothetical protein
MADLPRHSLDTDAPHLIIKSDTRVMCWGQSDFKAALCHSQTQLKPTSRYMFSRRLNIFRAPKHIHVVSQRIFLGMDLNAGKYSDVTM